MRKEKAMKAELMEDLFVPAATSEHTEMYLKAIYLLAEAGEKIVRVNSISKLLNVSPPSIVEMLRKLENDGYLRYIHRKGVLLVEKGERIGQKMVRNTRLVETLMSSKLRVGVDAKVACGMEHHMTEEFADALCSLLDHPEVCPHGYKIPRGKCCTGVENGE